MENLLTIETIPIKFEFVEEKPLKLSAVHPTEAVHSAELAVKQEPENKITSEPVRLSLQDYFEPSMSYAWENSTYTAIPNYDKQGNLKLDISMEDGEARAIRFKHANRSIEAISSQANLNNVETGNLQLSIPIRQISSSLSGSTDASTQFTPPDLQLVVTQWPEVVIKYVGGPIYVPPSADPNYKPPAGFQQPLSSDTQPLLDRKV